MSPFAAWMWVQLSIRRNTVPGDAKFEAGG